MKDSIYCSKQLSITSTLNNMADNSAQYIQMRRLRWILLSKSKSQEVRPILYQSDNKFHSDNLIRQYDSYFWNPQTKVENNRKFWNEALKEEMETVKWIMALEWGLQRGSNKRTAKRCSKREKWRRETIRNVSNWMFHPAAEASTTTKLLYKQYCCYIWIKFSAV